MLNLLYNSKKLVAKAILIVKKTARSIAFPTVTHELSDLDTLIKFSYKSPCNVCNYKKRLNPYSNLTLYFVT